jgi:hypothetical protein
MRWNVVGLAEGLQRLRNNSGGFFDQDDVASKEANQCLIPALFVAVGYEQLSSVKS